MEKSTAQEAEKKFAKYGVDATVEPCVREGYYLRVSGVNLFSPLEVQTFYTGFVLGTEHATKG